MSALAQLQITSEQRRLHTEKRAREERIRQAAADVKQTPEVSPRQRLPASLTKKPAYVRPPHLKLSGMFGTKPFAALCFFDASSMRFEPKSRTSAAIIAETARFFRISVADIKGPLREHDIVVARHVAIWRLKRELQGYSLPRIGRLFGGRDHTTVLNAIRKTEERISNGSLVLPSYWGQP